MKMIKLLNRRTNIGKKKNRNKRKRAPYEKKNRINLDMRKFYDFREYPLKFFKISATFNLRNFS